MSVSAMARPMAMAALYPTGGQGAHVSHCMQDQSAPSTTQRGKSTLCYLVFRTCPERRKAVTDHNGTEVLIRPTVGSIQIFEVRWTSKSDETCRQRRAAWSERQGNWPFPAERSHAQSGPPLGPLALVGGMVAGGTDGGAKKADSVLRQLPMSIDGSTSYSHLP